MEVQQVAILEHAGVPKKPCGFQSQISTHRLAGITRHSQRLSRVQPPCSRDAMWWTRARGRLPEEGALGPLRAKEARGGGGGN